MPTRRKGDVAVRAKRARRWEVGLTPIPGRIAGDPAARVLAVTVMADNLIAHAHLEAHPPSEYDELAALVMQVLEQAAEELDGWPTSIVVQYPQISERLRPLLALHELKVVSKRRLPMVDAMLPGFMASMGGPGLVSPFSHVSTWRAWGLPDEVIEQLLAAAAEYFRAAPWTVLMDEQILELEMPGEIPWWACVLGHADVTHGLALYADPRDLEDLLEGKTEDVVTHARAAVCSLTFLEKDEIPAPMRREIAKAGWPVASPRAYPQLIVYGTPGGGITRADARELALALRAIAHFTTELRDRLSNPGAMLEDIEWKDPTTGVTVAHDALTGPDGLEFPFPVPELLTLSLPQGPAARPEAALRTTDEADESSALMAERFVEWLKSQSPSARPAALQNDRMNCELFLSFLWNHQVIPPEAVTEYDLRAFLYRFYPAKVIARESEAGALLGSIEKVFAFLHAEGISCPWAAPILRDHNRFMDHWALGVSASTREEAYGWAEVLELHMMALAMIHGEVEGGIAWGQIQGTIEFTLSRELQRRWLIWRDELIGNGVNKPRDVYPVLIERQAAWEQTRNSSADGLTPRQAVAREQKKMKKLWSQLKR
jgi:hypothetical protein